MLIASPTGLMRKQATWTQSSWILTPKKTMRQCSGWRPLRHRFIVWKLFRQVEHWTTFKMNNFRPRNWYQTTGHHQNPGVIAKTPMSQQQAGFSFKNLLLFFGNTRLSWIFQERQRRWFIWKRWWRRRWQGREEEKKGKVKQQVDVLATTGLATTCLSLKNPPSLLSIQCLYNWV